MRILSLLLALAMAAGVAKGAAAQALVPPLETAQTLAAVNALRARLGLPPVRYNPQLDAAAKAYAALVAKEMAQKGKEVLLHNSPAIVQYTHASFKDFSRTRGYPFHERLVETEYRFENPLPALFTIDYRISPLLFVSNWVDNIEYRALLLNPDVIEAGFGWHREKNDAWEAGFAVMGLVKGIPNGVIKYVLYPYPGQRDVPTGYRVNAVILKFIAKGYPVTITFGGADVVEVRVESARMEEKGGEELPLEILDGRSGFYNTVALLAKRNLKPGKEYQVSVRGYALLRDGERIPFEESWSFETVAREEFVAWPAGGWIFVKNTLPNSIMHVGTWFSVGRNEPSRGPAKAALVEEHFAAMSGRTYAEASILPPPPASLSRIEEYLRQHLQKQKPKRIGGPFADLAAVPWAAPAAYVAAHFGWLRGTAPSRFDPVLLLTEAQAAAVLYRIAGEPTVGDPAPSGSPAWAEKALAWSARELARGEEIVPDRPIARSKLVAWTVRVLVPGVQLSDRAPGFVDDAAVPQEHRAELAWARAVGLAKGKPGGAFDPLSPVTRAEAAVLWCRAFVGTGCGE